MKKVYGLVAIYLFLVMAFGLSSLASAAPRKAKIEAANQIQDLEIRLAANRIISAHYLPARDGKPTFLLLPGVNRSLTLEEANAKTLARLGNGVITFDFSVQPLSVAKLAEGTKPFFLEYGIQITLEDLAKEVDKVAQHFKKQGVENIIPVSLSYSGAISAHLKNYPLIIETSPMTSTDAASPELAENVKRLRAAEIFNPIFGPAITRQLIDQAYRKNWQAQVSKITGEYHLSTTRAEDMIEGYMTLSHAAEGFDWSRIPASQKTTRVFMVGEEEAPTLFRSQAETFLRLSRESQNALFFFVEGAGHLIPADQPSAYSTILAGVPQLENIADLGGAIYEVSSKKLKSKSRADMEAFLQEKLSP